MKQVTILCAIILSFVIASPAYAGGLALNPSGTMGAYVDYIVPLDSPLADFATDSKTIYFYNTETTDRYRATYFRFGNFLTDYIGANSLEIVRWKDDSTIVVKASFAGDWEWIEGTETYLVSTDGRVEFTGFENLTPESEAAIDPAYLTRDFSYTWDYLDTAYAITGFMERLCSDIGTIDKNCLPSGIFDDPTIDLYDSFEDYVGCKDIIQYVMPREDGNFDAFAVWHSYVFDYDVSGYCCMIEYTAPQDL